jgi:Tfp pilus assembly protein PilX
MLTDKKIFSVLAGARRRKKSLAGSRGAATSLSLSFLRSGTAAQRESIAWPQGRRETSHPARPARALHLARALRRVLTQQSGVSLIWVLTVILVLLIASGAALLAVSSRFNITAIEHQEQQAYYTALSTLDTVSRWIASGYEPDAATDHYKAVTTLLGDAENEGGVDYPLENLDDTLGDCTLHLEYTDENKTSLELTATATFAGSVETLSMTMQRGTDPSTYDGELEAEDFDTTTYDDRAAELNALTSGGVIALYESSTSNYNTLFNEPNVNIVSGDSNTTVLDGLIKDNGSTREARWTNVDLLGSGDPQNNALGTQRLPHTPASVSGYTSDWRRFMVPKNGRITIDPLEEDAYGNGVTGATSAQNTRVVGLAIHGTEGKSVLFRLATGKSATGESSTVPVKNVFVSTTSSDYGTKISNAITESATFKARSSKRYASLITLDFTDNDQSNDTARYAIDGIEKTYPWHPDKWEKMDLFVQSSGELDTNLVLGPFAHKHDIFLDYKGGGNFVDSYHGQEKGINFATEWPYATRDSDTGLPFFSVDFGKNAGFWILDQNSSKYFRILQGVNILEGTIYSTRQTIIGGALIRDGSGHTTDGLNRGIYGYANEDVKDKANYVESTTRYSQLIYNTDIILMAPSSGTANSEIRRAQSWRSRLNLPTGTSDAEVKAFNKDTSYEPTMTIAGGTIYVGERQHLTIQGTTLGYKNGTDSKTKNTSLMVPLDRMWISPDKIVVAAGGALTIQKSETTNIFTDIYVEGGTLNINENAKIKGNIYAYNGGKVNIQGSFQLLSPHDDGNANVMTEAEAKDGILIYGDQLVGRVDGITSPGTLILPAVGPELVTISGSSNKVHILGTVDGTTVKKPNLQAFTLDVLGLIKAKLLCNDRDPTTGACMHFGFLGGEWIGGVFMHG